MYGNHSYNELISGNKKPRKHSYNQLIYGDLQLPMQSMPITTDVVSSNLDQDDMDNIMW
jgi:hypothetical protein